MESHQTRFWYRDQADAQAFFTFATRNDIEAAIYPGANPGLTHAPGEPGFIVSLGLMAARETAVR